MKSTVLFSVAELTLLSNILVQTFHTRVVPQQIQTLPVAFPEKLYPRGQNSTICAILCVLSADGLQQQAEMHKLTLATTTAAAAAGNSSNQPILWRFFRVRKKASYPWTWFVLLPLTDAHKSFSFLSTTKTDFSRFVKYVRGNVAARLFQAVIQGQGFIPRAASIRSESWGQKCTKKRKRSFAWKRYLYVQPCGPHWLIHYHLQKKREKEYPKKKEKEYPSDKYFLAGNIYLLPRSATLIQSSPAAAAARSRKCNRTNERGRKSGFLLSRP